MNRAVTRARGARRHPVVRILAKLTLRTSPILRADLYRSMGFLIGSGKSEIDALKSILLAEGREGAVPSAYQVAVPEFIYRKDSRGEEWRQILVDWVPTREALAFSSGAALSEQRLADLADDIDRRAAILRSARSAVLPFGFAIVFVAATLYGLGAYLFPEFDRLGVRDWSTPIAVLRAVSTSFADHWTILAAIAGVAGVLYVLALPRLTGPAREIFDLLPGTSIYALAVGLDWLAVMANLMQANVRHLQACELLLPHASPYLRIRLEGVIARPNKPLADALVEVDDDWPSRRIVRLLSIINHTHEPFDAIRRVIDQEVAALDRRIRTATETVNAFTQVVMVAFLVFLMLLTLEISSQPLL